MASEPADITIRSSDGPKIQYLTPDRTFEPSDTDIIVGLGQVGIEEGASLEPIDTELPLRLSTVSLAEGAGLGVSASKMDTGVSTVGVEEGDSVDVSDASMESGVGEVGVEEGDGVGVSDAASDIGLGAVSFEGPFSVPWMPDERTYESLSASSLSLPARPAFYLNFDEPHDLPKRIKDGWQRGTEATYWDGEKLRTAAPHEPRVQVDPETGERYLLAEPQRENGSQNLQNGTLTNVSIDSVSDSTFPDHSVNKIKADNVDDVHGVQVALVDGSRVSCSVFVKAAEYSYAVFSYFWPNNGGGGSWIQIDLSSGNIVDSRLKRNYEAFNVISYGGGWYRPYFVTSDDFPNSVRVSMTPNESTPIKRYKGDDFYAYGDFQGDGSSGILAFGVQSEVRATTSQSPRPLIIPGSTAGTVQAPDDLSNLPLSMASGAKSVYFRIEQEAGGYGTNEGGNVTNSEVNLTDTPGDAGGGLLRPSTGILGISASGWIDAVVNSTDEDLQGNSTSDVVDGLTIQPDKDPFTDGAIYRIHELVAWEEERTYDQRRSLTSERPQPWQELDPPNINTLDTLGGDIDWSTLGISEPPHLNIDIPRFGIPAKMRSAWQRDTVATYWDENGVLQTAQAGEPRLARSYDGTSWNVDGALAEPQRTNLNPHPRSFDPASTRWSYAFDGTFSITDNSEVGIDASTSAALIENNDSFGEEGIIEKISIPDNSTGWSFSLYLKKGYGVVEFDLWLRGGSEEVNSGGKIDTSDGTLSNVVQGEAKVEDKGGWWRLVLTANNNGTGNTTARVNIYLGAGGSAVIDAAQLENHHAVATDGNGYADATHATMPILTGGATRSEDKLVMPVWWKSALTSSGAYFEAYQKGEGPDRGGLDWNESFFNISDRQGYRENITKYNIGIWEDGGPSDGYVEGVPRTDDWFTVAVNSDNDKAAHRPIEKLYLIPDVISGNVKGATFVLRRMYLWPQELTEGSGGQLESLFNHDFSV